MSDLFRILKDFGIVYYANPTCSENIDDSEYTELELPSVVKGKFKPFEDKNKSSLPHNIGSPFKGSLFGYFIDGTRQVYHLADTVVGGDKVYPVVATQIRAGCGARNSDGEVPLCCLERENLLLFSNRMNSEDREGIKDIIHSSSLHTNLNLNVDFYHTTDNIPYRHSAIAKATGRMHSMEISLLDKMVKSGKLSTDHMLIVDGSLQFICEDDKTDRFPELFYNVVGVSKSVEPALPISAKTSSQIGAYLAQLQFGQRTPVMLKENVNGRKYGHWYLRIRDKKKAPSVIMGTQQTSTMLYGIVGVEKMVTKEEEEKGLKTMVVDHISQAILNERAPTCYGQDSRWASHIYPVYLTERRIKSSFINSLRFVNSINHYKGFKRIVEE